MTTKKRQAKLNNMRPVAIIAAVSFVVAFIASACALWVSDSAPDGGIARLIVTLYTCASILWLTLCADSLEEMRVNLWQAQRQPDARRSAGAGHGAEATRRQTQRRGGAWRRGNQTPDAAPQGDAGPQDDATIYPKGRSAATMTAGIQHLEIAITRLQDARTAAVEAAEKMGLKAGEQAGKFFLYDSATNKTAYQLVFKISDGQRRQRRLPGWLGRMRRD